jgi:hypothetical protein
MRYKLEDMTDTPLPPRLEVNDLPARDWVAALWRDERRSLTLRFFGPDAVWIEPLPEPDPEAFAARLTAGPAGVES